MIICRTVKPSRAELGPTTITFRSAFSHHIDQLQFLALIYITPSQHISSMSLRQCSTRRASSRGSAMGRSYGQAYRSVQSCRRGRSQ